MVLPVQRPIVSARLRSISRSVKSSMPRIGSSAPSCPKEFLLDNREGISFTVSVVAEIDHKTGVEAAIKSASSDADLVILPYLGTSKWFLDEPNRKGYAQAERAPSRTLTSA